MKNKLLILLLAISLAGCGESDGTSVKDASPVSVAISEAVSSQTENVDVSEIAEPLKPEEAKSFATKLLKKINDDELYIKDAYKLGEYKIIDQYVLVDLPNYMMNPYSEAEVNSIGTKYFPESDVMNPYASCDTALRDLSIYAGALSRQLKSDTAITRKIVREEKEDFEKSRAKCKKRVNMNYEDALKAYNAE
ncbi:hypothetical protein BGI05_05170 [Snodgrassella alvi]|uniref:hypothetical protein n=1 Tax=Snodgrassella alvi TaxID=1196083 RepID=UPI000A053BC3|nr:hypothetical protein [Snodgrassella alvi]ORF03604.1 hypothetical protein BGH97_02560 [Snodgrassella alvi]ORF09380.1 hypothetical protein BGH99_02535 [Snodgrassella alvi]ORF14703.1 hypothetical protein BGI00_01810 [Snodgrassella alvi]ORF15903.1 hypothetical protein BGI02_01980 [Snodgrassella alvi]ORF21000.1 hypothetical protein BGI05_05170 [Snodgrassella alvi]